MPAGAFGADRLRSEESITLNGTLGLANASRINGTLSVVGGTLQGSGAVTVNGDMSLVGGTVANTGGVTVNGAVGVGGVSQIPGALTANSVFNMVSGGTLGIAAGATLNLQGGGAKTLGDGTANMPVINNAGTITLAGNDLFFNGVNLNIARPRAAK